MNVTQYCTKCYKYLELTSFHKSKSKTYPNGHIKVCKNCIKQYHVKKTKTDDEQVVKLSFTDMEALMTFE